MPCHPVPDGSVETVRTKPPELPEFEVLGMRDFEMDVVEPSPFPGLPHVEGRIRLRVHSVEDPGLPALPEAAPQGGSSAPWQDGDAAGGGEVSARLAFVSAWVFEGPVSLVRCRVDGPARGPEQDPEREDVFFWSNVDFRHFGGVGSFQAQESDSGLRVYGLLLAADEVLDSGEREQVLNWLGLDEAAGPTFSAEGPQFVYAGKGRFPECATAVFVRDMHALYRDHGETLAAAFVGRREQWEARRAEAVANPPQPQDVNVFFWLPEGGSAGKVGGL